MAIENINLVHDIFLVLLLNNRTSLGCEEK